VLGLNGPSARLAGAALLRLCWSPAAGDDVAILMPV